MKKILLAAPVILTEMNQDKRKELITFLFKKCLFNFNSEGNNLNDLVCKSPKSRSVAMELITQLAKNDIKLVNLIFIKGFMELLKYIPEFQANKISIVTQSKKNN